MIEPFLRLAQTDCVEVLIVLDTKHLTAEKHGFPADLLETYKEDPLPLKLSFNDLVVVKGMEMEFFEDCLEATLGFDQLYRCTIPYNATYQITLLNHEYRPASIVVSTSVVKEVEKKTPPPHLKLV